MVICLYLDLTTFPAYLIGSDQGVLHFATGPTNDDALAHFVRPYLREAVAPQTHLALLQRFHHVGSQAVNP